MARQRQKQPSESMSRKDWGWIGTNDNLWLPWEEQARTYPLLGEQVDIIKRLGLIERMKPVYETCREIVGTEDILGYCFTRLHEDSSFAIMLERGVEMSGRTPSDIRKVTDVGAGEMRYILAVESLFPQLEECLLVDNDPERIRGARERIFNWGVDKGKYKVAAVDFKDFPHDERVKGDQDLIFLRNPDLEKDPVWQDKDTVHDIFSACAGKLGPDGVFMYIGRLRELAPWFGIGAKYGVEFDTIPLLKDALGVDPLVEPSIGVGTISPFVPTNFVVLPMNSEQTRTFGRLMSCRK